MASTYASMLANTGSRFTVTYGRPSARHRRSQGSQNPRLHRYPCTNTTGARSLGPIAVSGNCRHANGCRHPNTFRFSHHSVHHVCAQRLGPARVRRDNMEASANSRAITQLEATGGAMASASASGHPLTQATRPQAMTSTTTPAACSLPTAEASPCLEASISRRTLLLSTTRSTNRQFKLSPRRINQRF